MSRQYRRNPRPGAGAQPLFPMGMHASGEDISNPGGTQFPVRKAHPLFSAAAGIKHVCAFASLGSGPTWVSTSGASTRAPQAAPMSSRPTSSKAPPPVIRWRTVCASRLGCRQQRLLKKFDSRRLTFRQVLRGAGRLSIFVGRRPNKRWRCGCRLHSRL